MFNGTPAEVSTPMVILSVRNIPLVQSSAVCNLVNTFPPGPMLQTTSWAHGRKHGLGVGCPLF